MAVGYDPAAGQVVYADPARGLRVTDTREFEAAWQAAGSVALLVAPRATSTVLITGGPVQATPRAEPLTAAESAQLASRGGPDLDQRRGGDPVDVESSSFWAGVAIGGGVMLVILIIVVAV